MTARNLPYGYVMEKGMITVNEEEAVYVRRIFEMRLGGMGVYAIGKGLYEEQVPFFEDSRDKSIKKASAILYKPIYAGDEKYPPIIDSAVFDEVQKMKSAAFRKKVKEENTEPIHEEYELVISDEVEEMRNQIKEMMELHQADSVQVREMIIELAKKIYSCIRSKGESL